MRIGIRMDAKQLQEEQERLIHSFTMNMSKWLETFNNYADKLIENAKRTEEELKRLRDE